MLPLSFQVRGHCQRLRSTSCTRWPETVWTEVTTSSPLPGGSSDLWLSSVWPRPAPPSAPPFLSPLLPPPPSRPPSPPCPPQANIHTPWLGGRLPSSNRTWPDMSPTIRGSPAQVGGATPHMTARGAGRGARDQSWVGGAGGVTSWMGCLGVRWQGVRWAPGGLGEWQGGKNWIGNIPIAGKGLPNLAAMMCCIETVLLLEVSLDLLSYVLYAVFNGPMGLPCDIAVSD